MTNLPASVVLDILREVSSSNAVLLRGAASILRGEPQNDIDLFIPLDAWGCSNPFGRHQVISDKPIGRQQRKVHLKVAETGNIVEIDVFHRLTWRGIQIADVMRLPTCKIDNIAINCLAPNAEAWLTVVKNVLHGSQTPKSKLADMDGQTMFQVTNVPTGWLRVRLNVALTVAAWAAASEQSVSLSNVWSARGALILLRLLESPLTTLSAFVGWAAWRISGKVLGS